MPTDKELIDLFRRAPEAIAAAMGDASAEETRFSPAPGKWTIREIVAHLADTEIVGGMRLRTIIGENSGEEMPTVAIFNQDAWAKAFAYNELDAAVSLGLLRTIRGTNADMLARLPDRALDRKGNHPERGVMTARDWVERFTRHVERHAEQIDGIRTAWKASKSAANA